MLAIICSNVESREGVVDLVSNLRQFGVSCVGAGAVNLLLEIAVNFQSEITLLAQIDWRTQIGCAFELRGGCCHSVIRLGRQSEQSWCCIISAVDYFEFAGRANGWGCECQKTAVVTCDGWARRLINDVCNILQT